MAMSTARSATARSYVCDVATGTTGALTATSGAAISGGPPAQGARLTRSAHLSLLSPTRPCFRAGSRTTRVVLMTLGATFQLACGDDETRPTDTSVDSDALADTVDSTPDGVPDTATPPAATIRFALPDDGLPAPLAIPFPSDLYRGGSDHSGPVTDALTDWTLAGVTKQAQVMQQAYAGLDGFGHTTGALFRVDFGETGVTLDPSTLPTTGADCLAETSPVAIIDVTDGGPATRLPCIASYFAPLDVLVIAPEGSPLRGGRRYAVLVSDRIATTNGGHLGAAPDFSALLVRASIGPAATLYATAVDVALAALPGWSADHLAGAAVYSAHTEHRKLRGVRDALVRGDYGPAPTFVSDEAGAAPYVARRFCAVAAQGCDATLEEWLGIPRRDAQGQDLPGAPGDVGHPEDPTTGWPHDALGVVVQGSFDAPEFRRDWGGSAAPADGNFEFVDGAAKVQGGSVRIPVTIILPRTAPPAGGYPVAIFSHGTPSNRQFVMTFANELARAGIATVAMDGLYHGVRISAGADERNNYPGTWVGKDGFSDLVNTTVSTIELSATLQSAARYRANLWQYTLEWCQLRRLIANPALDLSFLAGLYPEGTTLAFNAARIGWIGTSFGSFTGATMLAIEPEIDAWFLNVGNGDGLQWQGQSPANRAQIELVMLLFGMDADELPLTRFLPFANIAFGAIEPGFASSFTEDVDPAGPDVLMTEVEFDEFVPNRSTEVLAAALGIPLVTPAARSIPLLATIPSPVVATPGKPARGLVHLGSASHSSNLGRRWAVRRFTFPEVMEDGARPPFPAITPPLWVRQPVAATQAMMVRFFTSAFEGAAVIDASAIPQRIDFDDDGFCDASEQAAGTAWDDPEAHPGGAPDCAWDPGY